MYLDLLIKIRELLKLSEIYLSHAPKDQKYVSVKRIKELIRFVRKRVLKTFRKRLKSHNYRAIESVLSMCSYSANYSSLIRLLKIKNLNYPKYLDRRISKWQSTHI